MSKQQKAKAVNTAAPKPAETQAPEQQNPVAPAADQAAADTGTEQSNAAPAADKDQPSEGAAQEGTATFDNADGTTTEKKVGIVSDNSEPVLDETAQEPSAVEGAAPAATEAPEPALSDADQALANAAASSNNALKTLGMVLTTYRDTMGQSKAADVETIEEQNAQLWAALRMAVRSGEAFRDCVQLALTVFRENADGAFNLNMLLRGIDRAGGRLNADHRAGYTGLVTLLQAAAGLNNPREVSRYINMGKAMESVVFAEDSRQRVIGFFS